MTTAFSSPTTADRSTASAHAAHGGRIGAARWAVEIESDGLLAGCSRREQVSGWVEQLLGAVETEQHKLSAEEIAALFAARGADFRAVRRRPP